jgi:hypothetical protein
LVSATTVAVPRTAVHQRDLAEEVAGDQPRQRATVAIPDLRLPLDDHVERVTGLALADDDRPLHEPLLVHLVREVLQETRRHAVEQRHLTEGVSGTYGHVRFPLPSDIEDGGSGAQPTPTVTTVSKPPARRGAVVSAARARVAP